jgi:arginyl-tRNA synthetase
MIADIKNQIKKVVKEDIEFEVVASEKEEFGHYSTNIAFKLAPVLKKSPDEIAQKLSKEILAVNHKKFISVGYLNGFINIRLHPKFLQLQIKEILKQKKKYGGSNVRGQVSRVNLEFVSANPTGPLTMANGRGGFYGDVLTNVLEKAGHKVTREYYINDTGNQIFLLGLSILNKTAPAKVEAILKKYKLEEGVRLYLGAYIDELSNLFGAGRLPESDPKKIGQRAVKYLLRDIKKSLKRAGIKFDVWFSEDKNLHRKGELKRTLEFLKKKGLVEEKDGAVWLKSYEMESHKIEEGVVLVKSDGNPTYFLADLAYHWNKFIKRKFDLAIDIWGADHHGYKARMENGIKVLGIKPERLKILITQLVRLVSAGKEVKMSKRGGEFVTMDDLIKEVGNDAARFFFLMHSLDTHMDFDLDLAKERSQKNPVYYTQYALVRAQSILKKSKFQNPNFKQIPKSKFQNLKLLIKDSEIKLILELAKLPDVLAQTEEDYQVHRLTKYAGELAKAFHNFYEKERVIGAGGELEKARLTLVSATKIVFENLFDILGISKPKKM